MSRTLTIAPIRFTTLRGIVSCLCFLHTQAFSSVVNDDVAVALSPDLSASITREAKLMRPPDEQSKDAYTPPSLGTVVGTKWHAAFFPVGVVLVLAFYAVYQVVTDFYSFVKTIAMCGFYICISAGLIFFNKYMMASARFPHPLLLTTIHMAMSTVLSIVFYKVRPSWYASSAVALSNKLVLMKYICPIAGLFSISLYGSNKAYLYSSVAFLQFIKETNLTVVYLMSCVVGLQMIQFKKVCIIVWILFGCTMSIEGEMNFVLYGLLLQVLALFAECAKNVMSEVVLKGAGLSLDPLTFTMFLAPMTLVPLSLAMIASPTENLLLPLKQNWHLLLPNSMLAFLLNLTIAGIIRELSTTSFVISGILKDMFVVVAAPFLFGDNLSPQQMLGFAIAIAGIACWSRVKLAESSNK